MLVCKPCADFQSPDAGISFKVHGLSACFHTNHLRSLLADCILFFPHQILILMSIPWVSAGMLVCQLTCLECTYIIWPSAGTLAVGVHICQLTGLEHPYIIWLSAGMLAVGVHICR